VRAIVDPGGPQPDSKRDHYVTHERTAAGRNHVQAQW
jgi:hypothetical protein